MSKPEVVAWMWRDINGDVQFNYMHPNGEELIRLTDHEAARAADKARIMDLQSARNSFQRVVFQLMAERNELLGLLRDIQSGCQRRDMPSEATIAGWDDRIDATLTKHGEQP